MPKKKILISGATGMVGQNLMAFLMAAGHEVTGLTRSKTTESDYKIFKFWDPSQETLDPALFENVDIVIHLAGESLVGGRWTAEIKEKIEKSRVESTRKIAAAIRNCSRKPGTFICASAIGFYGDQGDEVLNESHSKGKGFLADVCHKWEQAAEESGVRTVTLRMGMVLTPKGGALKKMLLPFRFGLGAVLGSGRQYWSWISIDDLIYSIYHCIHDPGISGPVNAVSPEPLTNRQFSKTLAKLLKRPLGPAVPKTALRLMQGELADSLLLSSARVVPEKLQKHEYQFFYPDLKDALEHTLGIY